MTQKKTTVKIGICTGGGDCPGLNTAIRALVKAIDLLPDHESVGIFHSFDGLLASPPKTKQLRQADVRDILDKGGTILGSVNRDNPYSIKSNDSGEKPSRSILQIKKAYEELGLDGIIAIGGDGTQGIASKLIKYDLNIIGIPKTIDNDLHGTERTIGFSTSVDTVTDCLLKLSTTAESHERIMIAEVMGRDAGHIALHAGTAGGANIILLPEIPFSVESIMKKILKRRSEGKRFTVICVAEGAFPKGKKKSFLKNAEGQESLGGISEYLAKELHQRLQISTRNLVLGHLQRGGRPNPYDRVLATRFAHKAIRLFQEKKFGRVVCLKGDSVSDISYEEATGKIQPVKLDYDLIHAVESTGVNFGRNIE